MQLGVTVPPLGVPPTVVPPPLKVLGIDLWLKLTNFVEKSYANQILSVDDVAPVLMEPREDPMRIVQVIVPLVPVIKLYGPEQLELKELSPSIEYVAPPPVLSCALEQLTTIETVT